MIKVTHKITTTVESGNEDELKADLEAAAGQWGEYTIEDVSNEPVEEEGSNEEAKD